MTAACASGDGTAPSTTRQSVKPSSLTGYALPERPATAKAAAAVPLPADATILPMLLPRSRPGTAAVYGGPTAYTPRAIGSPANPLAVKVMGAPPANAKAALGAFYHPHNMHLKKLLESQPHARCSPSLAELGLGRWTGS